MNKKKQISSGLRVLHNISVLMLRLEWVWIAVMILAFWHHSPPIRDQYVFLLVFAIPIYCARWIVHQRLLTHTPLDILLIIFLILTVYNFFNAPLSRESYFVLVCRPILGIFMIWYFAEHARQHRHLRYLMVTTLLLGIVIGSVALVASQWQASDKSDLFAFILDRLPVFDYRAILPDMRLSFNPNEIAGALAYFCSFSLAMTLGTFFDDQSVVTSYVDRVINLFLRWGALIGFLLTFTALFLGQSRFALLGVFIGLFIVILFVMPNWKLRIFGLSIWSVFLVLEIMIVLNVLPLNPQTSDSTSDITNTTLNERDERTLFARFDLWERALRMVKNYPTTGAGMSTYRAMVMRDEYMIPLYEGRTYGPPHAHNALFQMGADLGVMGLVLFVGWYGVIGWMLVTSYKKKYLNSKFMIIAVASGILSYMGYGIGDTITLWDRFSFLHWWFIALAVSMYILNLHCPTSLIDS